MHSSDNRLPLGLDSEIDLLAYMAAILKNKYWIVFSALICGAAAAGATYFMPDLFEAYTHIALVERDNPGGVAPDNRRAPEVLTLVEHGFIMGRISDNYRDMVIARMRSRVFTLQFIENNGVLPHLFAAHWDPVRNTWQEGFRPDLNEAYKLFHNAVRFIDRNKETQLMAVRMRWRDPVVAARWADRYVVAFNEHMRLKAIEQLDDKLAFLRRELRATQMVEIQKSIYRLIEAQTAMAMLANARYDYVLEILDPAVVPTEKFSPSRKRSAILGTVGGAALGLVLTIAGVMLRQLRRALVAYNKSDVSSAAVPPVNGPAAALSLQEVPFGTKRFFRRRQHPGDSPGQHVHDPDRPADRGHDSGLSP